eukprot:gene15936-22420_t
MQMQRSDSCDSVRDYRDRDSDRDDPPERPNRPLSSF